MHRVSTSWKKILKWALLSVLLLAIAGWILLQNTVTFRRPDAEAISDFQQRGITLRTANAPAGTHTVHVASTGADTLPTLLFIHGSPGGWIEFEDYLADSVLRRHFRLLSIDRPGFGYNSDYGTGLDLFAQANILATFLQNIDNGKSCYLLGHSLGGPIIALLAAMVPEQVDGLVIVAGALSAELEPPEKWRSFLKRSPWRYLLNGAFRASNDELFYFKKDVQTLEARLANVTCPVLIVHAENDMLVDFGNVAFMQQYFTRAKSVETLVFPEGNHFIHHNHFGEVRNQILAFIAAANN